jgi:hypothetical protein
MTDTITITQAEYDALKKDAKRATLLKVCLETLEQIANTPRNKGARFNAKGALAFCLTQIEAIDTATGEKN